MGGWPLGRTLALSAGSFGRRVLVSCWGDPDHDPMSKGCTHSQCHFPFLCHRHTHLCNKTCLTTLLIPLLFLELDRLTPDYADTWPGINQYFNCNHPDTGSTLRAFNPRRRFHRPSANQVSNLKRRSGNWRCSKGPIIGILLVLLKGKALGWILQVGSRPLIEARVNTTNSKLQNVNHTIGQFNL